MEILWDALLELDDLSSSTNSIMELMGTLLSSSMHLHSPAHSPHPPLSSPASNHAELPMTGQSGPSNLQNLVPRLWPFLSHTISSVRKSTLEALLTLLGLSEGENSIGGSSTEGSLAGGASVGGSSTGGSSVAGGSSSQGSSLEGPSSGGASSGVASVGGSSAGGVGAQDGEVKVQERGWLKAVVRTLLCQVFQRLALEGETDIRELLHKVRGRGRRKAESNEGTISLKGIT